MGSSWQGARAALDNSLVSPFEGLEKLKAARAVDVAEAIKQIKAAAEAGQALRAWILSESPEATWQNREELNALVEAIEKDIEMRTRRSRLQEVASELLQGTIRHRRAARVEQVNLLRDQAINELRSLADGEELPPALPGPEAGQWVQWACELKEPEDTKSLKTLRNSFSDLDAFVAYLEPGMWQIDAVSEASGQQPEKAKIEVQKSSRARLLDLVSVLELGTIQHHRASRVNQLNQLRDEAVKELQARAKTRVPPILPGPDVDEWIEWACALKEPEDVETLGALRRGFENLDAFVAHLEPKMWVAAGSRAALEPVQQAQSVQPQMAAAAAAGASAGSSSIHSTTTALAASDHARVPHAVDKVSSSDASSTGSDGGNVLQKMLADKRRVLIVTAAIVAVAVLLGLGWRSHRNHSGNSSVTVALAKVPDTQGSLQNTAAEITPTNAGQKDSLQPAPAPDPGTHDSNPKITAEQKATPNPTTETASAKPVNALDAGQLRTPARIPKPAGSSSKDEPAPKTDLLGSSAALPSNGAMRLASGIATATPKLAAPPTKISSGVTEGQVVHQVAPVYPPSARRARIEGTVVLQAVIAKDGSVESVHSLSGHPLLIQSAIDAVKQWRYKPFYLNGSPIEAETQISVKFNP
jgi:protein TonB